MVGKELGPARPWVLFRALSHGDKQTEIKVCQLSAQGKALQTNRMQ